MKNVLECMDYNNAFINLRLHSSPTGGHGVTKYDKNLALLSGPLMALRTCKQFIRTDKSQFTTHLNSFI